VAGGRFDAVYVAAGGIAPVPLRLTGVERAAAGAAANAATAETAARQAISGAKPLPMTGYKLDLLQGLVRDLLGRFAT
jgi:xanthine dehydrogenase YagS FAD-binding subunit